MKKKEEVCTITDCSDAAWQAGLCSIHYQRKRRGANMSAPKKRNRPNGSCLIRNNRGEKQCLRCKTWLHEDNFTSNYKSLDNKQPNCNKCTSEIRMLDKYGISKNDFYTMLNKQGGCAICKSKKPIGDKGWHVDHDHSCCSGTKTCGKCVRGILCSYCNKGLGQFFDSIEYLQNAINYLERLEK